MQAHDLDIISHWTQFVAHELVQTQDVIHAWKEDEDVSAVPLNNYQDELSAQCEDVRHIARSNDAAFHRIHAPCERHELCPW